MDIVTVFSVFVKRLLKFLMLSFAKVQRAQANLTFRGSETTQRPPGYVAHNISRDPGLVDCTKKYQEVLTVGKKRQPNCWRLRRTKKKSAFAANCYLSPNFSAQWVTNFWRFLALVSERPILLWVLCQLKGLESLHSMSAGDDAQAMAAANTAEQNASGTGGPAAVLDAGIGGLDTTSINAVFQASAAGPGEAADPNNDEIFLENRYYPCVLKVTFLKKESRLKQVAELKRLGERFLSLSVGAKWSCVILEMWHCSALAVPTRKGEQLRRAWDFSEEGAKLISGTPDGERLVHVVECMLNGTKLSVGMWFYFIRSYTNAQSVAKQLEHVDTHVALAKLLVISKRVIHGVVPEPFQILLNANKDELLPFTVESKSIQEQLLVKAKAELVSAKVKISEQDKEIAKLKLEDEDAKKIVDNALAALDEERKAKLSIEAKHKYFISQ
eukprot:g70746.t1